jgi:hypothetical protein
MNTLPIEILEHEIFSRLNLRDLLSLTLTEKHSQPASHSFYRRCRIIRNLILDESGKYIDHTYPIIRTIVRYPNIEYKILQINPGTMINYHDYKIEPARECYSIRQNQILGRKLFENPDPDWLNAVPGIEIVLMGNRIERDQFGNPMDSSFLYGALRNIITKVDHNRHHQGRYNYVHITTNLKHSKCIPLCSIFSEDHGISLDQHQNYHDKDLSIMRPGCKNICGCGTHTPLIKWSDPNEHSCRTSCKYCSQFITPPLKADHSPGTCTYPAPFLIYNNLIDRWIFVKFYNVRACTFY